MEEIEIIHSEKQKVINDHHNTIEKLKKQLHTSQKNGSSMSAKKEKRMKEIIESYENQIADLQT